jgi:hypothetical protein
MKKIVLIVALLLVVGAGSAYAVPVNFNMDELYDWGREYTYNVTTGAYATSTTNINAAGGPDVAIGTGPFAQNVFFVDPSGAEDSWGVASIASITSNPPGTTYFQRSLSQELTLMFYGFDDSVITSPNPVTGDVTIGAKGGHAQVWLDTNSATFFNHGALGGASRTGLSSYATATEGLLVLDLVPVANPIGLTLQSNFDSILNLTGAGSMFLSTTGLGAWDSLYDTNGQLYGSDISLSYTVTDNEHSPTIANWTVRGDARGESSMVPEPMSMLMVTLGVLGFGVAQRKRKKIV